MFRAQANSWSYLVPTLGHVLDTIPPASSRPHGLAGTCEQLDGLLARLRVTSWGERGLLQRYALSKRGSEF